jgi:hypothetical protein
VFSGVLIAEEVDRVGDNRSGDTTIFDLRIFLNAFWNMSLISACFFEKASFSLKAELPVSGLISSRDGLSGFLNCQMSG